MGAIAESIMAYAQPLLDETDGSLEEVNKALSLSQICWNLALMPEETCKEALREVRLSLKMEAGEFEAFCRKVVDPMIRRHEEMFPRMHGLGSTGASAQISAPPLSLAGRRSATVMWPVMTRAG
jgi:hypothetical protein